MLKRVTIKDLADELKLSVCTINKALNGKPRISEETRQRVVEAARKLGYQPNRLAQALARRSITIGVVHPGAWQDFYGPLVEGVREGLAELEDHNVSAMFTAVEGSLSGESVVHAAQSMAREGVDGLIVCPGYEQGHLAEWQALAESGIPIVFLGTDVRGIPCLSSVRQDAERSGHMACELLSTMVGGADIAILVGSVEHLDHKRKTDGLMDEAKRTGCRVVGVYETMDDPAESYPAAERIFEEYPEVRGLYIATDNSPGACRYLIEHGLSGRVKVVGTGTFPEISELVRQGVVQFTLFQNMGRQGRLAVRSLYLYLSEKIVPGRERHWFRRWLS